MSDDFENVGVCIIKGDGQSIRLTDKFTSVDDLRKLTPTYTPYEGFCIFSEECGSCQEVEIEYNGIATIYTDLEADSGEEAVVKAKATLVDILNRAEAMLKDHLLSRVDYNDIGLNEWQLGS